MKEKELYNFSLYCGLITITGGLIIFISWWIARAWFAIELNYLEVWGYVWILLSVPMALLALAVSVHVFFINYKTDLKQASIPLLTVFSNIPIVYFVLVLQSFISSRAYIKIVNESGVDNLELSLSSTTFIKNLGILGENSSTVIFFYPSYQNKHWDSVPLIDSVTLSIQQQGIEKTVLLPPYFKSDCGKIIIDEQLNLKKPQKIPFNHQLRN